MPPFRTLTARLWQHRRAVLLALVPAGLLGLAGYSAAWHVRAAYHHRRAERAIARGEFAQALDHLQQYLAAWPDSGEARLLAARTARRAGQFDEAERQLKECKRLGRPPQETELEAALLAAQQGELAPHEKYLRACVNRGHPDSVLILEAMSKGLWKTYRFAEAAHYLRLWLDQDPDNVGALYLRAQTGERLGRAAEALADYQRVVEIDPGHDEARLQLAEALERAQRFDEAAGHFEFVCRRQSPPPEARLGLARCQFARGEPDQARALLDALLAESPGDAAVLRQRGKLALQTEGAAQAERWLREALRREPNERDTLYDLYLSLQQQGKDREAKETLALVKQVTQDVRRLSELTKEIAAGSRDPGLRHEAGMILLKNGQEKEGLRWLASALHEDPTHAPTCRALADFYARTGDAAAAERFRKLAEQAGAARPEDVVNRRP